LATRLRTRGAVGLVRVRPRVTPLCGVGTVDKKQKQGQSHCAVRGLGRLR